MGGSNLSLVMYVCFLIPMLLSLFSLGRRERLAVGSILVGATVCLAVSGLNAHLYVLTGRDMLYYTTTISPVVEEIVKALPVLIYAFAVSSDRDRLISISFAVGLGFAIMENMIIFTQNLSDMNVMWAIVRGFGAGLMHSVCTVAVGIGISLVRTKKKLFYCGTAALLMMAVTYHAIFNTVALSAYRTLGFALPVLTYIPILCLRIREKNTKTV